MLGEELIKSGAITCGKYFVSKCGDMLIEMGVSSLFDFFQKPGKPGEVVYSLEIPEDCSIFVIQDLCEKYAKPYFNPNEIKRCRSVNLEKKGIRQYRDTVGIGKKSQRKKIQQIGETTRPLRKESYTNVECNREIRDTLQVLKYNDEIKKDEAKQIKKNTVTFKFIDDSTNKEQKIVACKNRLKFFSSIKDQSGYDLIRDIASCLGIQYTVHEYGKSPEIYYGIRFEKTLEEANMDGFPDITEILKYKEIPKRDWLQSCQNRFLGLSVEPSSCYSIPIKIEDDLMIRISAQCSDAFYNDPSLRCELCLLYDDEGYLGAQLVAITDNETGIYEKSPYLTTNEQEIIEFELNKIIYDKYKYLVDKDYL